MTRASEALYDRHHYMRDRMKMVISSAVRVILSDAWDVIATPLYEEVGAEKQELVRQWLANDK